jgi:teichuronic acid biosynthesis glycosyltransferase TuaC
MSRIGFPIRRWAATQRAGGVDRLLLTSTHESWPNVMPEALACGTPVVAPNVGAVGRIVGSRDAADLAGAFEDLIPSWPDRDRVREHALHFDGSAISKGQPDFFARITREPSDQLAGSVASLHSAR